MMPGSLMLTQDVSGLYFAVSSPYLPINVTNDPKKLAENVTKLGKEQSRVEIFEIGTGRLAF